MVLAVPLLGLAAFCGVLSVRGNHGLDLPTFFLGCFGVVALLSAIWPKVMLSPRGGDEDDTFWPDDKLLMDRMNTDAYELQQLLDSD